MAVDWTKAVLVVSESGQTGVTISGEIDASNSADLCASILSAAAVCKAPLLVDLTGVTFIDSTGLRALGDVSRAVSASGSRMVLCNAPRPVLRIIEIMGLGESLGERLEVRR